VTVPLAGCSSSDDEGTGDDGDTGGNNTDGDSDGPSATGESGLSRTIEVFPDSVAENVEVVAVEEVEVTDTRLEVNVRLRNTSEQEVRMDYYAISLTAFTSEMVAEDAGDRAQDRVSAVASIEYDSAEQEPTPAGETVTLGYSLEVPSGSDATIGSYLVTVACGGVYEPPGCG
jgi:hypothetical protein